MKLVHIIWAFFPLFSTTYYPYVFALKNVEVAISKGPYLMWSITQPCKQNPEPQLSSNNPYIPHSSSYPSNM
jgi:hypothetical protein